MRVSYLIVALAVAAPVGFYAGSASAQFFEGQSILGGRIHGPNAPWCGHEDIGGGTVEEDCSFESFEACRRVTVGVNNGFCTPNPAYSTVVNPVRKKKSHRRHR